MFKFTSILKRYSWLMGLNLRAYFKTEIQLSKKSRYPKMEPIRADNALVLKNKAMYLNCYK